MSTHTHLNGEPGDRQRRLSEICLFCDARAGEPCHITSTKYKGQYICPDDDCEELYKKASDAMNCTMHLAGAKQ